VQYRETAFNFVSRLMEQEGIYYFFEHEEDKHTAVLADSISAHRPFPGYGEIVFRELDRSGSDEQHIGSWVVGKEVQPGAYALNDFDPLRPKTSLRASAGMTRQHGAADFEVYDYPGEYVELAEGMRLSDVRLAELQCQHEIARGESNVLGLCTGRTFALRRHPRASQNPNTSSPAHRCMPMRANSLRRRGAGARPNPPRAASPPSSPARSFAPRASRPSRSCRARRRRSWSGRRAKRSTRTSTGG
jgi:Rhs element Vgr protein